MSKEARAKKKFFATHRKNGLALTFDDVRLRAAAGQYDASEVDTTAFFSTNVELKIPLVSAAMDTVTESKMAIAMAKLGGLGVIHAAMTPERQRQEARRVKLHLNGLIETPITVGDDQSLSEVLEMCDKREFAFRTFPVIDGDGLVVGLLTQNDFDLSTDNSQLVGRSMTPLTEVVRAPAGTSIEDAHELMLQKKKKTIPLLNDDGTLAGLYIHSDVRRLVDGNPDHYNLDDRGRLRVAAAIPTNEEAVERVRGMIGYLDVAVIDTAQGDSKHAFKTLKDLKEEFPDLDVVVGNISEGKSARMLLDAKADGIKVGQGPGSICTTRVETGIGTPQVTAVYECVRAIKGRIPVCADGGIREAGDVPIALAAGAFSVMGGGMFAGTEESPGEIKDKDGIKVKEYRGMGSPSAMRENPSSRTRYGHSGGGEPLAEGIEAYVAYKGSVVDVVGHHVKALRKSMAYYGARDIEALRRDTQLWYITNAGLRESHPHDVVQI